MRATRDWRLTPSSYARWLVRVENPARAGAAYLGEQAGRDGFLTQKVRGMTPQKVLASFCEGLASRLASQRAARASTGRRHPVGPRARVAAISAAPPCAPRILERR